MLYAWDRMRPNERAEIEAARKCCGFKEARETISCQFPKEMPCGKQIVSLQKDYLMTLGLLIVSVAAAEVHVRL